MQNTDHMEPQEEATITQLDSIAEHARLYMQRNPTKVQSLTNGSHYVSPQKRTKPHREDSGHGEAGTLPAVVENASQGREQQRCVLQRSK